MGRFHAKEQFQRSGGSVIACAPSRLRGVQQLWFAAGLQLTHGGFGGLNGVTTEQPANCQRRLVGFTRSELRDPPLPLLEVARIGQSKKQRRETVVIPV